MWLVFFDGSNQIKNSSKPTNTKQTQKHTKLQKYHNPKNKENDPIEELGIQLKETSVTETHQQYPSYAIKFMQKRQRQKGQKSTKPLGKNKQGKGKCPRNL